MGYQKKQVDVYQDGVYRYQTDDDSGNRPWYGKTWTCMAAQKGEIAAARVWDKADGATSRWSII